MLTIKLIFKYQVKQERIVLFFFKNEREQMKNERRNNWSVSKFLFFRNKKKICDSRR